MNDRERARQIEWQTHAMRALRREQAKMDPLPWWKGWFTFEDLPLLLLGAAYVLFFVAVLFR